MRWRDVIQLLWLFKDIDHSMYSELYFRFGGHTNPVETVSNADQEEEWSL